MPVSTATTKIINLASSSDSTTSGGSSERSTPAQSLRRTIRPQAPPPPPPRPDDPSSTTSTDAVHIRFREPPSPGLGPAAQSYLCHTCSQAFEADSMVQVMRHFAEHVPYPDGAFHSPCLYCQGKVHRFQFTPDSSNKMDHHPDLFYHDCNRWRMGLDR